MHPIFRVLDQISRDVGAEIRYENTAPLLGRTNRLTVGVQPAFGNVDNRHFENVEGERGELRKDQRDEAGGIGIYVEDVVAVTPRLSAVLGLRYDRAFRRVEDFYLDDGDQSDDRTFRALQPKVGVLYEIAGVGGQLFANVSRSLEPPLLLELNSLSVPGFIDLDAQRAWQLEVGTRGRAAGWRWQVAVYDMELENEILNVNVPPFPGATFTVPTYRNAERTRHYGLEAGIEHDLPGSILTRTAGGDGLAARVAYTFNRFRYVRDEAFEGNAIPGAPEHVLQGELTYRHPAGLSLRPSVEWVPRGFAVNSENTVKSDGWTVLGIRAEWELAALGALAFVELRNLTDAVYSPSVNVDNAAARFFQPADGRSLYAGVR